MNVDVRQNGISLDRYYLSGVSDYNSKEIRPGDAGTAILCYELEDGKDNIDIVIRDNTHYANPIVLEASYTIDEIVDATVDVLERFYGDDSL